jgi:hypothetical protein
MSVRRARSFLVSEALVCALLLSCQLDRKPAPFDALRARLPDLEEYPAGEAGPRLVFSEKVWAHHLNTIEKAVWVAEKYTGIEMDIVFNSLGKTFEVRHPPNEVSGPGLEQMLATIPDVSEHYFWLDFKNLEEGNKREALLALKTLLARYQLLNRVIVESPEPEALSLFTQEGFYTSYYLPTFDIATAGPGELQAYYNEVREHLSRSRVSALSAPAESFVFMEKYFPDRDYLVWHLNRQDSLFHSTFSWLKGNKAIKVLLVTPEY